MVRTFLTHGEISMVEERNPVCLKSICPPHLLPCSTPLAFKLQSEVLRVPAKQQPSSLFQSPFVRVSRACLDKSL